MYSDDNAVVATAAVFFNPVFGVDTGVRIEGDVEFQYLPPLRLTVSDPVLVIPTPGGPLRMPIPLLPTVDLEADRIDLGSLTVVSGLLYLDEARLRFTDEAAIFEGRPDVGPSWCSVDAGAVSDRTEIRYRYADSSVEVDVVDLEGRCHAGAVELDIKRLALEIDVPIGGGPTVVGGQIEVTAGGPGWPARFGGMVALRGGIDPWCLVLDALGGAIDLTPPVPVWGGIAVSGFGGNVHNLDILAAGDAAACAHMLRGDAWVVEFDLGVVGMPYVYLPVRNRTVAPFAIDLELFAALDLSMGAGRVTGLLLDSGACAFEGVAVFQPDADRFFGARVDLVVLPAVGGGIAEGHVAMALRQTAPTQQASGEVVLKVPDVDVFPDYLRNKKLAGARVSLRETVFRVGAKVGVWPLETWVTASADLMTWELGLAFGWEDEGEIEVEIPNCPTCVLVQALSLEEAAWLPEPVEIPEARAEQGVWIEIEVLDVAGQVVDQPVSAVEVSGPDGTGVRTDEADGRDVVFLGGDGSALVGILAPVTGPNRVRIYPEPPAGSIVRMRLHAPSQSGEIRIEAADVDEDGALRVEGELDAAPEPDTVFVALGSARHPGGRPGDVRPAEQRAPHLLDPGSSRATRRAIPISGRGV